MKVSAFALVFVFLLSAPAHAEKRTIQAKKTAAKPKAVSSAPASTSKRAAGESSGSVFNPPPIGNAAPVASGSGGSKGKTAGAGSGESEAPAAQHGALIRSEGLVTPSGTAAAGRHEVDGGGNYITDDPGKSLILNPHPGVRMGKADTPPSSGASGKNGVVANSPAGEQ